MLLQQPALQHFQRIHKTGQTLLVITHENDILKNFSQVLELRK